MNRRQRRTWWATWPGALALGAGSLLLNIVWIILVGWWLAIGYVAAGVANMITIIGIPFGIQSFKMAKLALWPFGASIHGQ